MRIVFMGTPDFSVPVLKALISRHEVIGVVTQPDRRKGRGKQVQFPPVKEEALRHGIPVFQPKKVKEEAFLTSLREMNPDVIVVAAFGQILPEAILNLPKYGCINVHASLLPKYRGAAPIQWAVINGETESGVTIMYMEKGLDTGDMLGKTVVPLDPKETGESLHDKLSEAGGPVLLQVLDELEQGTAKRIPQNDEDSSYAGMLSKELGNIDWTKDAVSVERLVRGLNSWPCAYTGMKGKMLKVWDADPAECIDDNKYEGKDEDEGHRPAPGTVVKAAGDTIRVACGEGYLDLKEVQLPGKKRMKVHDFLLGHSIEEGFVFTWNEK